MRKLEVEFVNRSCALVRGHGSRDLIVDFKRRAPVWATRDRAWVVQPSTAVDIIAAAESRGWQVLVSGVQAFTPVPCGTPQTPADPAQGLW